MGAVNSGIDGPCFIRSSATDLVKFQRSMFNQPNKGVAEFAKITRTETPYDVFKYTHSAYHVWELNENLSKLHTVNSAICAGWGGTV